MENITTDHQVITLPGFRFHPTEEELVDYYLKETALGNILHSNIIGFLNIYKYQPWDLPGMANIGEREWYFFVPTEKRYRYGGKANRTTETGYWKATGSGRHVRSLKDPKKIVGLKKIFVFYTGKAPKGSRTDWVMNEYTLISAATASIISTEDLVLCKIYRKAASIKELEKRAEEHAMTSHILSSYDAQNNFDVPLFQHEQYVESAAHQKAADSEPIMESVGLRPIDEIQLPVDPGLDCTKLDSIEAQSVPDIHILFDSLFSTSFPM